MSNNPEERKRMAWENILYSVRQMDALIIAISGGGIYVCLETMKFVFDNEKIDSYLLLKVSGLFFASAVIVNFISQSLSYKANYHDYLMSLYAIEGDVESAEKENSISASLDKKVSISNNLSMGLMSVGLILLVLFFLLFI